MSSLSTTPIFPVLDNTTTKEDLKSCWEHPQGNPYQRGKKLNYKNSLFPQIKKYSILSILRQEVNGVLFSSNEDNNSISINASNNNERKIRKKLTGMNFKLKKSNNNSDSSFVNLIKSRNGKNYNTENIKPKQNNNIDNKIEIDTNINSVDISSTFNFLKKMNNNENTQILNFDD